MLNKKLGSRQKATPSLSLALSGTLEQEIVNGQIHPGTHVVERTLCERFKVSRAVVRESIFRLERQGLVEVALGGGARVTELTQKSFLDAYYFREGLEVTAAEQCAQRMNREEIETLLRTAETITAEYEKACQSLKNSLLESDQAFHRAIIEGSRNTYIQNAWSTAMLHFFRGSKLPPERLLTRESRRAILVDHHTIAQAIAQGDGEAAGRVMKHHIQAGRELILQHRDAALRGPLAKQIR
jgi:DNA-binding GntR family transcriptional regulator